MGSPPLPLRPRRIAIVVNANARRFARDRSLIGAVEAATRGEATVHVTDSRETLATAARAIIDGAIDAVIICSGDGGYGSVVTAIHAAAATSGDSSAARPLPRFVFGPGGTVGTVARALGMSWGRDLVGGVRRAVKLALAARDASEFDGERHRDARFRLQPTLAVSSRGHATRLAFIFGTGLVARFFEVYAPADPTKPMTSDAVSDAASDADPELRWAPSSGAGLVAAARIVGGIFVDSFYYGPRARAVLDPMPCRILVDGEPLAWGASSLVVGAVVRDLGLGMRVTYRAAEEAARPHFVVSGLSARELGPRMPRVLLGGPIVATGDVRRRRHFDDLASTLDVEFGANGASGDDVGPFVVDGDLVRGARVHVAAGPTIRVLAFSPDA